MVVPAEGAARSKRSWTLLKMLRRRPEKSPASSRVECPTRPSSQPTASDPELTTHQCTSSDCVHHNAVVQEVLQALETLRREASSPAPLPIAPHDRRLPSGDRGVSLDFLAAIDIFYERHGGRSLTMGDVCKDTAGEHVTVCTLTLSTGLSLAESVAHVAERDGLRLARGAVSRARGFFSYSWTGTALVDMLAAIDDVVRPLEADNGERHVWVDMFCASQNLLAGVYRTPSITKESEPAGYLARKEDTDRIFDDALEAVSEVYFYCSPLVGEWEAPPHPFLSPQRAARGAPPQPWVRRGAAAITRAWCLFELSTALGKGCKLHVALSREDRKTFGDILAAGFEQIANIVAAIDARDAQISKVEDRGYILGRIESLAPGSTEAEAEGLSHVTARVSEALRGWLVASAREELARLAPAERATSKLLNSVGGVLFDQGDYHGAEPLLREALAGRRERLGDRHPDTLESISNLGGLLHEKGDLEGAEALAREAVQAKREALGDRHPETLAALNNLAGLLFCSKGDLDGAEPLLREALDGCRELGDRCPYTMMSITSLSALLRMKGDLDGAEPLAREAVERCRKAHGDRHLQTLGTIANLGSLLEAKGDPDSADTLLREAVQGLRETLGDRHPHTLCSIKGFGWLLRERGDLDGAEPLLREAVEGCRETLSVWHPCTLESASSLGWLLRDRGDLDGAEPLFREALEGSRETHGDRHKRTLPLIGNYADLLREKGDLDGAQRQMGDAPEVARAVLGEDHEDTLVLDAKAARIEIALGEADATPLRATVARMEAALGAEHRITRKYSKLV